MVYDFWVHFSHTNFYSLLYPIRNKNNKLTINMYIKDYIIKQTQTRRLLHIFMIVFVMIFVLAN